MQGTIMTIAKPLIPNKEWIVEDQGKKIGTLSKTKGGYIFFHRGISVTFNDFAQAQEDLHFDVEPKQKVKTESWEVYGYSTKMKPYNPLYDVKHKLPLYTKSAKSQSQHGAGHYVIKFPKGWVKSFCPKLITLQRYPYAGPFHTDAEARQELSKVNRGQS